MGDRASQPGRRSHSVADHGPRCCGAK